MKLLDKILIKSIVSGSTVRRFRCINCILIVLGFECSAPKSMDRFNGTEINNSKVLDLLILKVKCIMVNDKDT